MANKTISFRIPDEITEALDTQVKITGRSRTSLIVEALTQMFGLPQASPNGATTTSLEHQLKELEKQVTTLSSQLAEFRLQTQANTPCLYKSKLLNQAVISFQALSPAADIREDLILLGGHENWTATAEER